MKIDYTLKLTSDAEPGTGAADVLVDQRIPRNREGLPIIPANHLKGLIREELMKLEFRLGGHCDFLHGLADRCAGRPGSSDEQNPDDGREACFRLNDAVAENKDHKESIETKYVSRTAIDPKRGRAKEKSLRTVEQIPVGTVFQGTLFLDVDKNSQEGLAVQLAMLSLESVGGNRNRGNGRCIVRLKGETVKPGDLLNRLFEAKPQDERKPFLSFDLHDKRSVAVRLVFEAESPICCPETPVRANVIRSGFTLPASAVQGLIVNRIARDCGDEAATFCFTNDAFRVWPLLPCSSEQRKDPGDYPIPIRVSLTHRVAKLVVEGDKLDEKTVVDTAIEEIDWSQIEGANPLKASDGVLLRSRTDRSVELWKSRSMPRIPTAHGVLNDRATKNEDGRNLYQLESMSPIVWSGIVLLPHCVAEALKQSLDVDPFVSLGRSRTVRGNGRLRVLDVTENDSLLPWTLERVRPDSDKLTANIVIVQSPIRLEDRPTAPTADEELKMFVEKHWGLNPSKALGTVVGVQFGWNRHGIGTLSGKGKRIRACRVVQPGAVIVFDNRVTKSELEERIKKGLGGGREQGFGAVAFHPGKATKMYDPGKSALRRSRSVADEKVVIEQTLEIWRQNRGKLPSSSQLAEVRNRLAVETDEALRFLDRQKTERTERIWATWEKSFEGIRNFVQKTPPKLAAVGLKLLIDLVVADGNNTKSRS